MSIPKIGLVILGLLAFVFFVVSVGHTSTADQDADIALKESSKQGMYLGINKGAVRVNEEVTLNYDKVKEGLVRSAAEQVNYRSGELTIYIHDFNSKPAMLATEVYSSFDTPLQSYLQAWDKKQRDNTTTVREQETTIFEAKNESK